VDFRKRLRPVKKGFQIQDKSLSRKRKPTTLRGERKHTEAKNSLRYSPNLEKVL